ncbi:MAG TPA: DoxX family protein [Acidobacteriaceae bacterium]|nr:DoxX family protein [Acidobacteriaceae bacterium]
MRAVILIRILVGWVFVSEGIQKFLFPDTLGAGRFAQIRIPLPQFTAPLVGFVEIVFGVLIILGLFTRLAAIPLLVVIGTAIATTKVPIMIHQGVWPMLHEARVDFSMVLGLIFLLIVGGGAASIDDGRRRVREYRTRRREEAAAPKHTIAGEPKTVAGGEPKSGGWLS